MWDLWWLDICWRVSLSSSSEKETEIGFKEEWQGLWMGEGVLGDTFFRRGFTHLSFANLSWTSICFSLFKDSIKTIWIERKINVNVFYLCFYLCIPQNYLISTYFFCLYFVIRNLLYSFSKLLLCFNPKFIKDEKIKDDIFLTLFHEGLIFVVVVSSC